MKHLVLRSNAFGPSRKCAEKKSWRNFYGVGGHAQRHFDYEIACKRNLICIMSPFLLVALGSQANGVVPVDAVDALFQSCKVAMCTADVGDIWVYATPILHASEAAQNPARRRVLQLDFAAFDLPGGLEWGDI